MMFQILSLRCLFGVAIALTTASAAISAERPASSSPLQRSPQPSLAPPPAPVSSYLLGVGDQVEITIVDYKEFTGPRVVLPDGTISLPVIGSIMAANRSPDQLAQELTQKLRPFLKTPLVSIAVTNTRPLRITVAGEVQRPGLIQLRNFNPTQSTYSSSPQELPTVHSALVAAGGVSRNADIRQVVLRRTSASGEPITLSLNLWEAIWSGTGSPSPILQDGDSLFVPKIAAGDKLDQRLIARSNLAPRTVRVRVVGEVKKPGEVEVPPNSSISSAVAIAGGPTDKAQIDNVTFVRLQEDGKVEQQVINLSNLTDTYQIQDGDVVIVPKSGTSSFLDFASQLFLPLNVLVNLLD